MIPPWAHRLDVGGTSCAKGIEEVGIVGTAAAIASAVYHATGIRVRDLPIRLDKLLRPRRSYGPAGSL